VKAAALAGHRARARRWPSCCARCALSRLSCPREQQHGETAAQHTSQLRSQLLSSTLLTQVLTQGSVDATEN
jgi:hypothetical protein